MADQRETIVIDSQRLPRAEDVVSPDAELVSWVMGHVMTNRKHRDNAFKSMWDEYYRIWRGKWSPESKTRKSERSRLVAPATQMAVDMALAEMIEAIFGTDQWFDITDDVKDQEREDAVRARDNLREDLYKDGIIPNLIAILQNGALYGQLIGKIATQVVQEPVAVKTGGKLMRAFRERVAVFPVPVEPGQLVWDMSGPTRIDDMIGVAHEFPMPLHVIKQRQETGTYKQATIVGNNIMADNPTVDRALLGEAPKDGNFEVALVTEWHGLVPKRMLVKSRAGADDKIAQAMAFAVPAGEMVEAIVTIANESALLRGIPNPSVMNDRAIVAEQFDTVTNRFMGRGIVEKGYNSQKGLDTELRSRADALAWINNPMLAGDLTRLPPKMDLNVWPGKFFGTKGDPNEILREFRFADVNASTFSQTQEYQQMVAQATGAADPATMRQGVRDEAAGAASLAVSGMIKRNKRTMFHIESFLNTMLRRIMWRKMQFEPDRYPADFEFQVKGTMGIMARELEVQQLIGVLQYTKDLPGMQAAVVTAIIDHSASPRKAELKAAIQAAMQPNPEEQQYQKQVRDLQLQTAMLQAAKLQAEVAVLNQKAGVAGAEQQLKLAQARAEAASVRIEEIQARIDSMAVAVQIRQTQQQDRALDLQERSLDIQARESRSK